MFPFVFILCYNVLLGGALIQYVIFGGIISSVSPPQPSKDSRWFPALVVSRVIFVPLLVMCNVQDRNYTPVLFSNDLMFAAIMVFFSGSSGYFVCLSMTYAPQ